MWKSQLLFWPELEFLSNKVTNDRGIIPESSKITIGVTIGKAARFANTVSYYNNMLLNYGYVTLPNF